MFARSLRTSVATAAAVRRGIVAKESVAMCGRAGAAWISSIAAAIDSNVAARPHREVYKAVQQDLAFDCRQVQRFVNGIASGLLDAGYKKGSKIALWMSNETEHWIAQLGALRIGAVVVSIDPSLSAKAVGEILRAEGCRGVLYSERFQGAARSDELAAVFPEVENTRLGFQLTVKTHRPLRHLISTADDTRVGFCNYRTLYVFDDGFELSRVEPAVSDDDVALVQYNKGGDADSFVRGKQYTHKDLVSEAKKSVASSKLTADDVICVTAPLNTPAGFISGVLASVLTGAKVVVPGKEFAAADAAQAIKDFRVTALASTSEQAAAIASATGGAKLKFLSA